VVLIIHRDVRAEEHYAGPGGASPVFSGQRHQDASSVWNVGRTEPSNVPDHATVAPDHRTGDVARAT
jgi:hypothetical protein